MRNLLIFIIIIILFSCKKEKAFKTEFEKYRFECDSVLSYDSKTFDFLTDSLIKLTERLNEKLNYNHQGIYIWKKLSVETNDTILKDVIFSRVECQVCETMYKIRIMQFKNNRVAFDYFAESATLGQHDSINLNRIKNFKDALTNYGGPESLIYFNNIVIRFYGKRDLHEQEEINVFIRKLLIDKEYKEIEFAENIAYWSKK